MGEDWIENAVCRTADAEDLFVQGTAQNQAKTICTDCSVRTLCLAYALDHRIEYGIWGGTTERERRRLLKRKPAVTSWRPLLESAQQSRTKRSQAPVLAGPAAGPGSAG
ncbi:WhiB family transcriptional regulator [Streptomyces omiyaensis]|uniref:Transcriptional regulator WhiB n=1 Tax=Streptomyces omiyaensis TaxID=68247 RepID=A0ABW7BZK7_9ACTN|nr:WhiB family transcriptional regulator [Streptomyces omiyaensis]GGY73258.1 transcriptional regulator WhiB [Streptomyces omiyaensis]